MAHPKLPSSNVLAGERTDLAVERTFMAASRTLMAWVRTGLSLISFGFTIYKVLQAAGAVESQAAILRSLQDPKRMGVLLIGLGTFSILLGSIEYFGTVKRLNAMTTEEYKPWNFAYVMGMLVGLFGLYLCISILTGHEIF